MKIKLFLLVILIFINLGIRAQWQWQNPLPQGNTIVSVCFVDATNGWAAGVGQSYANVYTGDLSGAATILHTSDGGLTWETQESGGGYSLYDICFTDVMHGWAVGVQGTILRTIDGGNTWLSNYNNSSRLPSSTTSVCFVDSLTGWAVGWAAMANEGPVIKQTTDGGITWDIQIYPSTFFLGKYSIYFIDHQEGWIAWGDNIIHSNDGGIVWEDQESNTVNNLQNIFFMDSNYGWAVGNNGTILYTTNGGGFWEISTDSVLSGACLQDISFIDATHGWAAGYYENDIENGVIFKTTDGGVSWVKQISAPEIKSIYCLTFENGSNGFAAGKDGEMLIAQNGGNQWDEIYYSFTDAEFYDLCFVDNQTGWVVGGLDTENGAIPKIFHSVNGGETWINQEVPFNENQILGKIIFIDNDHGWALGKELFHTTDGGENWEYQTTGIADNDISFINPSLGWCVGGNGTIQKTTDGGWNWEEIESGTERSLNSVFFVDENNGWAAGDSIIINTSDGGETWIEQTSGSVHHWYDIHFVNQNNGWIVGYEVYFYIHYGYEFVGYMITTSDGGNSWEELDYGSFPFSEVYFADEMNGWVGGTNRNPPEYRPSYGLWRTYDGGISWEEEDTHGMEGSFNFCFIDTTSGWIAGNNVILHKENQGTSGFLELNTQNSTLSIQTYPNPGQGMFNVQFTVYNVQSVSLRIYDLWGREVAAVLDEKLPAGEHVVQHDLSGLPAGIYLVQVMAGEEVGTKKLIVVH